MVLVVSYVFFQLLRRYRRHKEEASEFQNLLLQAVSHKLGNYLASQRVDLELVRESGSHRALKRLERGSSFLERDFRHIIRVIRDYRFEEMEPEELDLGALARDAVDQMRSELDGKLRDRLGNAPVRACRQEAETVVYLLVENAARYSASRVALRSGQVNGVSYLFIQNDVAGSVAKGTGVGLSISERLSRRNGMEFRTREGTGKYLLLLARQGD